MEGDGKSYILIAEMASTRILSQLLKTVHFKEHAVVCATVNGFKVTVEHANCVQACAFIQADMFEEYVLKEDIVTFKINLAKLLECLNIFGTAVVRGVPTQLKMCYAGSGSPFILEMTEDGVETVCEFVTREPEDMLDFSFSAVNVVGKIIFQSECLKDIITNLDPTSDVVEFLLSPDPPHFRISTVGNSTTFQLDIPKHSDAFESFECARTLKIRYRTQLIKFSAKALNQSQKASIRMDDRGFLCFQFQIKTEDEHCCFVDYYVSPQERCESDHQN